MICNLTTEAVVFTEPILKMAPSGSEYLSFSVGLFNIKETGAQEYTRMDCPLWSNPNLAKRIMEMGIKQRDRILINGKFTIKTVYGKPKLRLYIYDFTLLGRAGTPNKTDELDIENIDYSFLNEVQVFDMSPVKKETNLDDDNF